MAGQLGDREQITFRGFRGVDLQRTGIFPEAFVPQEDVSGGLLLDARNCRFSNGRVYWHRNQLRVKLPAKYSGSIVTPSPVSAARVSNVVTVTCLVDHGLIAGNRVTISSMTPAGATTFNGSFTIATAPTTKTFTYAQTAADDTGTGGTVTPTWPLALYEFVNEDYNQMLCIGADGALHTMPTVWSDTPTVWDYGYQMFAAGTWTESATGLPDTAIQGFADALGVLMVSHGDMATKRWNGVDLKQVGLSTPTTAPTGAGDVSGSDELVAGVYSYYVTFGDGEYESMPSPPVDVTLEETAATGYIDTADDETVISDGDAISVNGVLYTFKTTPAGPGDIEIQTTFSTPYYNCYYTMLLLARAIREGFPGVSTSRPLTERNEVVTAASPVIVSGHWRVALTARAVGAEGNVTVSETSDGSNHFSVASLTGGVEQWHIDLSAIPTGPTGTTYRRLWRAYTADIFDGARGTSFQYLATINDNTTTTYADHSPQGDLGEPIAFDHAMPPQGDLLVYHRDRIWMSGVAQTSLSYQAQRTIAGAGQTDGAERASNVVTITTTTAHTLTVGDTVIIAGVQPTGATTFDGSFTVTATPTPTSFTYSQVADDDSGIDGTATYGVYTEDLGNVLFYSQADEPSYWPAINQVMVGVSGTAIVGMVSWHDELLIFKTDGVFRLIGYGESDWQLIQIPGCPGALSNDVATSPFGVMWAGPSGWMMYDGQQVRVVLEFSEKSAYSTEIPNIGPPRLSGETGNTRFPAITWHDDRFHLRGSGWGYTYCWKPQTDTWETYRRSTAQCGFRAFAKDVYQSHALAFMRWGDTSTGLFEITVLDSLYKPTTGYGNTKGTAWDPHGDVNIELPPIAPSGGLEVVPLELFISGQWTKPASESNDLKLQIHNPATPAWPTVVTARQESRTGIPAGYAYPRLRLRLYGAETAFLALHGLTLTYNRRAARGYTP